MRPSLHAPSRRRHRPSSLHHRSIHPLQHAWRTLLILATLLMLAIIGFFAVIAAAEDIPTATATATTAATTPSPLPPTAEAVGTSPSLSRSVVSTLSHPNVRRVELVRHRQTLDSKKAQRLPISSQGIIDRNPSASTAPLLQRMRTEANTGHVTLLTGCAATIFSTPITIGSQTFAVLVDTGSSSLAVASSQCTACGETPLSPRYSPGPTATQVPGSVQAVYGSGSWSGRAFRDDVAMAGLGSVHMTIGAIDQSSSFFQKSSCQATYQQGNTFQGILGMAYGRIAPEPTDAYWDALVDDSDTPDIFAMQMCTASGRMWTGGYDAAFFAGALAWTPIIQTAWYVVGMGGLSFGSQSVSVPASAYGTTIVDSGTTAILMPNGVYSALVSLIEANSYFRTNFGAAFYGSSQCVIPMNGADRNTLNANLPKLSIALNGGVTLSLNAVSSYIIAETDDSGTVYYCSGLSGWDNDQTILGYAALNQYTVVYDRANTRIGFAPAAYCDTTSTPPVSSYDWYVSAWGTCTPAGDVCIHNRTMVCKDSNANVVSDSSCAGVARPAHSEECTVYADGPCHYEGGSQLEAFVHTNTFKYLMIGLAFGLCLCCMCACCCEKKRRERRTYSPQQSDRFHAMHPEQQHVVVVRNPNAPPTYSQYQYQQGAVGYASGPTYASMPAQSQRTR